MTYGLKPADLYTLCNLRKLFIYPSQSADKRLFLNKAFLKPYSWITADDNGNIYALRIGSTSASYFIDIHYTNYAYLQVKVRIIQKCIQDIALPIILRKNVKIPLEN